MTDSLPEPRPEAVGAVEGGPSSPAPAPSPTDTPPSVPAPAASPTETAVGTPADAGTDEQSGQDDQGKQRKKKKKDKKKGVTGQLGSTRGIETMFRTSYRTHLDLSQMADNKANIMISINGIIISVVIASVSPKIDSNPWLLVPTTVLLVGCVTSLVYAVLSARPRVTSHVVTLDDVRSNRANILFFGNFVNMNESDFLDGMVSLLGDTDSLYTSMMRDLYSLGGVLAHKYRLLRTAYTLFMISLVVSVMLFITVFVAFTPTDIPL